jgi:transglutaminase-like putative cysteine protease
MRCDLQEIADSRVRLRYSVELGYDASGEADFLLNVHAAKTDRQLVVEEQFELSPFGPYSLAADPATANRVVSFTAGPGRVVARYEALVDIAHRIVDPAHVIAEAPALLPVQTLRYLYPSRYCESDLVSQRAWDTFGQIPRGYGQVRAVRDWVNQTCRFQIGTSNSATSALDTLRDGVGVCRDFAHTMIAFCRALNYPARFVTGVDYGADPALGPPDFHAYVEVFVGGAWFMFDPTGISPITGLVRIATGRDAAEVSFATIFGPVATGMPRVVVDAIHDPAQGFVTPVSTDLAVSTAD